MNASQILVVYPEVNSTSLALYQGNKAVFLKTIKHPKPELRALKTTDAQLKYRLTLVNKELKLNDISLYQIEIIVGRSGLLKPLKSGAYEVNGQMKQDLENCKYGDHPVNLGALIALELAQVAGVKAMICDPVVTDEMQDLARITGHPDFKRKSVFHALNHKHIGRKFADSVQKNYEDLNLIIAHVGNGGVSVGAHYKGKVIDVNNAFDGSGPFSVTRTGSLPMGDLVRLCFSGKYTYDEVMKMLTRDGGYKAYLGTDNLSELDELVNSGHEKALLVSRAFGYQISKEIASHFAVLKGQVDAIILTGFVHHSPRLIADIRSRVEPLAPLSVIPSVQNFDALAHMGYEVVKGDRELLDY